MEADDALTFGRELVEQGLVHRLGTSGGPLEGARSHLTQPEVELSGGDQRGSTATWRQDANPNLNGAPATACQGSSESSAPPHLIRLSPEQLHRPELPEARCPVRAGGQLLFWVVMFQ
jgi:hypothetical protein